MIRHTSCALLVLCVIGLGVRGIMWLLQYPFVLIVLAVAVAMAIVGSK